MLPEQPCHPELPQGDNADEDKESTRQRADAKSQERSEAIGATGEGHQAHSDPPLELCQPMPMLVDSHGCSLHVV